MSRSPIETMIDAAVRCSKCNAQNYLTCGCWTRCACGHLHDAGERCANPVHLPYKSTATLSELGARDFSLAATITVEIDDYIGEVIASWQDHWGAGKTEAKATAQLKRAIVDTHRELLGFDPATLGAVPARVLAAMREVIMPSEPQVRRRCRRGGKREPSENDKPQA